MTKADVKSTTQNVVIPGSVVVAALAALVTVLQSFGAVPTVADRAPPESPALLETIAAMKERMAQYEARQVELDRQNREDRANMMALLIELRGDVKRIEGKLEK